MRDLVERAPSHRDSARCFEAMKHATTLSGTSGPSPLGCSPGTATAESLRRCSPLTPCFSRALLAGRILAQDRGRRQRWRSADALTPAARRKRLFGVDGGEQLLDRERRGRTERLVEVDCLRKLLADE